MDSREYFRWIRVVRGVGSLVAGGLMTSAWCRMFVMAVKLWDTLSDGS